ncbi:hypothetical protein [Clostridium formicaceticum]|uniref:Uncharacterized protein n=1 Tax=Clostridium formicaceticum TaxID=1497 RepID=A0AAC9RLU7_9CLOT|nr:hypothetical protein [Clostridium formicaceticum]AOY77465.1 hypothetical protein BJL90_17355 [Clostridium formicaceticum]ARE88027.1 hypothetical protein CLFO_24280 [Clostridium formicaceticum]
MVALTLTHWIYVVMVFVVLVVMVMRRDTLVPCILGIFLMGLTASKGVFGAIGGIFDAFVVAGTELLGIIFVISVIVSMSRLLEDLGANQLMVKPFTKLIKTPDRAFWFMGFVMFIVSWFFWPSPATALVGAVLLPVALKVGLPAIGAAMAINLFGHGLALSTDFVIQGAPTMAANAAQVEVTDLMIQGLPLFAVMGIVTIITAYILLKKDMKKGLLKPEEDFIEETLTEEKLKPTAKVAAILVPLVFTIDIIAMFVFQLKGGDATALIGGTAVLILLVLCFAEHKKSALEAVTKYIKSGFVFGMEIFGPIIPIAAFFYMGDISTFAQVMGREALPAASQGILADLGNALASIAPMNKPTAAVMEMTIGAITGLDGSGFSGVPLVGALARVFGTAVRGSVATLAALGQIGAIWVGGGTIVPWGLIPAAAICKVAPMDLARRNFIPVIIGLIVTTIVAMFII